MPKFVRKSLTRLQHKPDVHPQFSPHEHVPIQYGIKGTRQYATAPDDSPYLSTKETTHIQQVTGCNRVNLEKGFTLQLDVSRPY